VLLMFVSFLLFLLHLEKLSTTDDVTKYRGIPISRYFYDGILGLSFGIT